MDDKQPLIDNAAMGQPVDAYPPPAQPQGAYPPPQAQPQAAYPPPAQPQAYPQTGQVIVMTH